jgi:hypothetical protein
MTVPATGRSNEEEHIMSTFILTFRGATDRVLSEADGAAWMAWFGELGNAIVDPGSRVGATSALGVTPSASAVTGYTIIQADDLEAAAVLAKGCPGLTQGGGVEVGEIIAM